MNRAGKRAIIAVGTAFFLAELGDKTMLATITLATDYGWFGTWLGSTLGMVAADALAIVVGRALGKRLPEKAIAYGAVDAVLPLRHLAGHRGHRRAGVDRQSAGSNRVRGPARRGYRPGHAVPLTQPAALCPPAGPSGRGLGRAVRAGALLPALRAAVPRHRPVRRADLGAVRDLVGHRLRPRGALPARSPTGGPAAASSSWRGSSRRSAFAVWTAAPAVWAFAAGFVIWGVAGALVSGASEALIYDGLAAVGAADSYVRVNGWMTSAELLVQIPTAFAAERPVRARRLPGGRLGERRGLPGRGRARPPVPGGAPAGGRRRIAGRHPPRRACARPCTVRSCGCSCSPSR